MMRRIWRKLGVTVVLVGLALATSACWAEEGWESGRTFYNALESTLSPSNVAGLTRQWTSPKESEGAPVVGGGSAYEIGFVNAASGAIPTLYSIDETTGTLNWSLALGASSLDWITSPDSPALGNSVLGGNGLVFADISQYPSEFSGSTSYVVAVNLSSVTIAWSHPFNGVSFEGPLIFGTAPSPASGMDVPALLASTSGGYVAALDPNAGIELQAIGPGMFNTSVAVGNGPIFVGGRDGDLYSLNPTTGNPNWAVPVAPKCGQALAWFPAVDGARVIVTDPCGQLAAFDATTGKLLWRTVALASAVPSWVAIANGQIVVASGSTVFSRSDSTGKAQWQTSLSSAANGGPTIANGVVYLDDGDGLVTLKLSTGHVIGTLSPPPGASFGGEAVVTDGQVFVYGSGTGLLDYGL
jgi:outer membrane protein assembly factor BamB